LTNIVAGTTCPRCDALRSSKPFDNDTPMKQSSGKPAGKKTVFGVAWYRPEQWRRLVEICSDADTLDDSYEHWLRNATARFDELTAAGFRLKRVDVDVERLLAWCVVQGRPVDNRARAEYAAKLLEDEYKNRAK
jgi:hypothetical protein